MSRLTLFVISLLVVFVMIVSMVEAREREKRAPILGLLANALLHGGGGGHHHHDHHHHGHHGGGYGHGGGHGYGGHGGYGHGGHHY